MHYELKIMDCELSIVIPVRDRASLVRATLDSIEAQTCRDFRVILVDNASTDDTLAVLRRWASATTLDVTVLQEPRPGCGYARNKGLEGVDTRWIMPFDSDDVMPPDHVQSFYEALKKCPKAQVVGWDRMIVDPEGNKIRMARWHSSSIRYRTLFHGMMSTQAFATHTSIIKEVGGWDVRLTFMDDRYLSLLILNHRPVIVKATGKPVRQYHNPSHSLTGGTYTDRHDSLTHALDVLEAPEGALDVLRGIIAGKYRSEGSTQLAIDLSQKLTTPLGRVAFWLQGHGCRGVARILRPLIPYR